MDVRNCRQCGRLFNYIGGSYRNLCPNCVEGIEEKFGDVKEYIEENKTASIGAISEACDVSVKQLEQWIREERLTFADDSPIGIACEACGATIKSGKYCENCKNSLASQFGNMYKNNKESAPATNKNSRDSARMRFLDK